MERIDLNELEKTLAIYAPWKINSVNTDEKNKLINVFISEISEKRIFGFLKTNKHKANTIEVKWVYMPLGHYQCVIHAKIEEGIEQEVFNNTLFAKPAFIGHSKRKYSNYIRQQVCLAQIKGLDVKMIANWLHIDNTLVSTIIADLTNSSDQLQTLAYLPCEADRVWQEVLSDKRNLSTKVLPLKFLLSKLKLNNHQHDSITLMDHAIEMRKFFIANVNLLQVEIAGLVDIDSSGKQKQQANKNKLRLVLPSTRDPVWLKILGGEIKLNSNHLALNLLISRLRNNINQDVLENINQSCASLREYFKKNYRSLKTELILINQLIKIKTPNSEISATLPEPNHKVWQQVIESDDFLTSDHVAFNLLMARLRLQLYSQVNPLAKEDAAQRIHDFMHQNQKLMRKEFNILLEQSQAA